MKKRDFDFIKSIIKRDKATVDEIYLYLGEEVGEVAHAIAAERGLKRNDLKEPPKSECVDVIISSLGLFAKLGGTYKEFGKIFDKKSRKWDSRV